MPGSGRMATQPAGRPSTYTIHSADDASLRKARIAAASSRTTTPMTSKYSISSRVASSRCAAPARTTRAPPACAEEGDDNIACTLFSASSSSCRVAGSRCSSRSMVCADARWFRSAIASQLVAQLIRGGRGIQRQLVEYASFAERKVGVQIAPAQQAQMHRVIAVELAHRVRLLLHLFALRRHCRTFADRYILIAFGNYMPDPWARQYGKKHTRTGTECDVGASAFFTLITALLLGLLRRRELAVLLIEPGFQRREVFDQRAAVDLVLARDFLQRYRPRFARAHGQHRFQLGAGLGVAVDRAAMQRTGIAGLAAQRAVELELQQVGQEVARVRCVRCDVELGAGVEAVGVEIGRALHAHILLAQLPPALVVIGRLGFAGVDIPAPLVDRVRERQDRHLAQGALQQLADVGVGLRRLVHQADLLQVIRRDRQRDGVADRFVEAVVGAVAEQEGLLVIREEVVDVSQLVVDGGEILS